MIAMLAISIVMLGAMVAYYWPYAARRLRVRRMQQQLARSRTLVLTYDDGPSPSLTPRILDILRKFEVRATFFMLGSNALRYPDVADRIVGEGHETGCHTDQHLNAWKVSPWRSIRDINTGYRALSRWVRPDALFRPPYGKITLPTYRAVCARGAEIGWWTLDSGDSREMLQSSPEDVVREIERAGGGVVLMHDLAPTQDRAEFVCRTTELLLRVARSSGMTVKTMSELRHA